MDDMLPLSEYTINVELPRSCENVITHCHANARMIQNVLLIWLDNRIDEDNNVDCRNTLTELRRVVSNTKTFTDGEKCIEFNRRHKNENVCMIVSGSLGQNIVRDVHHMTHVDSIFIFCGNKSLHESWAKEWPKIKGIHTEISPICAALQEIVQKYEQKSIHIMYMPSKEHSGNDSGVMNFPFLFTRALKEVVANMNFDKSHFLQWIAYCREALANDESESKNIDVLKKKYHKTTPIWWFAQDCFLYSMLNRSLRLMDLNVLDKISFFINDLHQQIERLHKEKFTGSGANNSFTVYHGQGVPNSMAEQIIKSKSGFISFNNFLCVSTDRKISYDFAHRAVKDPNLVGMLFVLTIDPSKTKTPFAFINGITRFEGKDEVLFPMDTIFCIRDIQFMGENNRQFQVDLTLANETNDELRALNDHIQEEIFTKYEGWDCLDQLLIKIKQFDEVEEMYNALLEQNTCEKETEGIHHPFNGIKHFPVKQIADVLQEISGEIQERILPTNHSDHDAHSMLSGMSENSTTRCLHERRSAIVLDSSPSTPTNLRKWQKNLDMIKKKLYVIKQNN